MTGGESMRDRLVLGLIIVLYVGLGTAFAIGTPKWQTPDEPAHFNYIRDIAQGNGLPVLKQGDFDIDYLERIKAARFPDSMPVDSMRYESHQPPLYYLLAAPILKLGSSLSLSHQVILLRLFSVFLGACLLVVAYSSTRTVFGPGLIAVSVPAFIAFIPQHVAMTAAINNDTLAELVLSLVVLLLVRAVARSRVPAGFGFGASSNIALGERPLSILRFSIVLGLLLGAALLTKLVVYVALVLTPIGLLAVTRGDEAWSQRIKTVLRQSAIAFGIALLVAGWWFVRNAFVYGNFDILGSRTHDAVAGGQQLTGTLDLAKTQYLAEVMFRSFWAQFGWMGVPADTRTYVIVGAVSLVSVLGFIVFLIRSWSNPTNVPISRRLSLGLLGLTLALVFTGVMQYNLQYLQPQGRYLFPALLPIATFACLGMKEVFTARFAPVLMTFVFVGLSFLSAYSLVRFVIPWLS